MSRHVVGAQQVMLAYYHPRLPLVLSRMSNGCRDDANHRSVGLPQKRLSLRQERGAAQPKVE